MSGKTVCPIAKVLTEEEIRTPSGRSKYSPTTVESMQKINPVHIQRIMADIFGYSHRPQSKALATARVIFDAAAANNVIMRSMLVKYFCGVPI